MIVGDTEVEDGDDSEDADDDGDDDELVELELMLPGRWWL